MKLSSINNDTKSKIHDRTNVLNDEPVDPDGTTDIPSGSPEKRNVTIQDKIINAISQNSTRLKLFDQRMDRFELELRKFR